MLQKARFAQIVGANIKKARLAKGMNQDELADECGFYRTYINLLETAKRTPSSFTLYKVSRGLGIDITELYPKKSE